MKITEIKYMRRFNLGNYEHEELALSAFLEDGEDHFAALANLKADISSAQIGETSTNAALLPTAEATPTKTGKGKDKKPKPKVEPKEEAEEETDADEETADPEEEAEGEEAEEAEEETEEEPEEEKPAKTSKKFKKKPQTYSRDSEAHKELFSKLIGSVAPDWKKTAESKEKAKSTSQQMVGKDFLDEAGEVLPAFKDEVKKLMGKKK